MIAFVWLKTDWVKYIYNIRIALHRNKWQFTIELLSGSLCILVLQQGLLTVMLLLNFDCNLFVLNSILSKYSVSYYSKDRWLIFQAYWLLPGINWKIPLCQNFQFLELSCYSWGSGWLWFHAVVKSFEQSCTK